MGAAAVLASARDGVFRVATPPRSARSGIATENDVRTLAQHSAKNRVIAGRREAEQRGAEPRSDHVFAQPKTERRRRFLAGARLFRVDLRSTPADFRNLGGVRRVSMSSFQRCVN